MEDLELPRRAAPTRTPGRPDAKLSLSAVWGTDARRALNDQCLASFPPASFGCAHPSSRLTRGAAGAVSSQGSVGVVLEHLPQRVHRGRELGEFLEVLYSLSASSLREP